jgi:hypothetical protein
MPRDTGELQSLKAPRHLAVMVTPTCTLLLAISTLATTPHRCRNSKIESIVLYINTKIFIDNT